MTAPASPSGKSAVRLWQKIQASEIFMRLAGPGFAAFLIKLAGAGLSYLMLVAFARLLHNQAYGQFGLMLNLSIVLAAFIGVGMPTAILRLWPEYMVKSQPDLARGAVLHGFGLLLAVGAALLAVAALLSLVHVGETALGLQMGAVLVVLLALFSVIADYVSSALRAFGHTVWSMAPRDILWRIASPALAGIVLYATGSLSAGMAVLCASLVLLVLVTAQCWKARQLLQCETADVPARGDWRNWRKMLLPIWAASVLYQMIQQLDVVVVGALIGPTEAGSYFAAQKTASLLGLAMLAGGLVAAPMMAAAFHAGKRDELQKLCRMLSLAIAVTTLAGLLFLALFGRHLLAIFDPNFTSAYGVLMILCIGYAIDSLSGPNSYLMQMTSLERPYLTTMCVVYALVLSLQLVLVPRYGMTAAAGANALGTCLWNITAIWLLRTRAGVDPSVLSLLKR